MPNSEVLIVGTGALASLFAARFLENGVPVTMLGSWPEGLAALAENGVQLIGSEGRPRSFPVNVTSDVQVCQGVRYALVLVKSWQTRRAAEQLRDGLASDGLALTLQNGLGNLDVLSKILGSQRAAVGSTTLGAHLLSPGVVKPAGDGVITLGMHNRLKVMADLLGRAGFVVESTADINAIQWGKLVINAAINPLTALLRVPNGELLSRQDARSLLSAAAREAAAVAVAKGIALPFPDPVIAVESIARRTANNYSSMLQDVRRGAPTEVDEINGAVVRAAEKVNLPAPVNRTLWLLVKAMSAKANHHGSVVP